MILHAYFARKFLWTFLGIFMIFVVLLTLVDLMDELQDFSELPFGGVLEIVLLNLPSANYEMLPLIMILSTAALFVRLARSSELVVVRAVGRSALRALIGPLVVASAVGVISVTMLNPIVAASSKRYSDLVKGYRQGGSNVLAISSEGLWLRQGDLHGQIVIHASRASSDLSTLYDTSFIAFTQDGAPLRRINAEEATLGNGEWLLSNVKLWDLMRGGNPESTALTLATYSVPSALTKEGIIDSFGKPEYIPLWDLPAFIRQLEKAGFSARRYSVWFQMELAKPIFLIALVLVTAAFSMRHTRLGNTGVSVLTAIMLGFGLYYIRNFAQILGENGQIPVLLAAWAPPVASLFLAIGILLHMEDG
ncbi:putative permease YjgP/YjgQ family protein [Roseovarius litorisediminis]|uniref:Putative permease YjgP/YjgQ family protein n=1 Tax=Roseovarius litorisediminis TaxID=1312363 RepID=A0A1Y5R659_9RHOB|nr:LPS export ABC transporter permease LptG [Roseovarius litorisediminis]SLN10056.1 putative permease YjgP/YjgQ family protein [Roseovarius litorisediminis]